MSKPIANTVVSTLDERNRDKRYRDETGTIGNEDSRRFSDKADIDFDESEIGISNSQ
ncbi:MAG: hypothetical protein J0M22_17355 [Gammaproteobacteria bacterium]|nr:hypothetical protein [Gammaproteobacteria bacterium]